MSLDDITPNPDHPWANAGGLRKRFGGFLSYSLAAFVSLICPVLMDKLMFRELSRQFGE